MAALRKDLRSHHGRKATSNIIIDWTNGFTLRTLACWTRGRSPFDDLFRSVMNSVQSLGPRITELRYLMLEERAPANVHCGEILSISCLDDELVDVTVHR